MGGTMYDAILNTAGDVPFVRDYFSGDIDRDTFRNSITENNRRLEHQGLDAWQIDLLRRMPIDEKTALNQLFSTLADAGVLETASPREAEYNRFRKRIRSDFTHFTDRFTSIFPEEGRIAFELSSALRPARIVVAGSYYAFLAVWMIPGLSPGGTMECIDPDREVSRLAEQNMVSLGFADRVKVTADDAVRVISDSTEPIDILVVDAYGASSNPDPEYRGKTIYGPILRAAMPRMKSGSVVMAHNADRTSSSLDSFFETLEGASWSVFLDTTEHLAVFGL